MKPSKILKKAAAEVRKPGGWQRGEYGNFGYPEGAVCAVGAIARVVGTDDPDILAAEDAHSWYAPLRGDDKSGNAAVMALNASIKGGGYSFDVINWNDDEERTAEEVAELMLKVAKQLKAAGE